MNASLEANQPRNRPLGDVIEQARGSVKAAGEVLEMLEKKLEPVLIKDEKPSFDTGSVATPRGTASPMQEALLDTVAEIQGLLVRIDRLHYRLDL